MKERTNNYFYLFSKAFTYSILIWIWQRFEQSPSCGEPWNIEGKQNDSSGLRASRLLRGDAIMDFHQGYPQYRDRYMQGPVDHRGGAGGGGFAHQLSSLLKDKRIQKKINKMLKGKKQHGQMNDLRFNGNIDKLQKLLKGEKGYEELSRKHFPNNNYDSFQDPRNQNYGEDRRPDRRNRKNREDRHPDPRNASHDDEEHSDPRKPNYRDERHPDQGDQNYGEDRRPDRRNRKNREDRHPDSRNASHNDEEYPGPRNRRRKEERHPDRRNRKYREDRHPDRRNPNYNSMDRGNEGKYPYDHEKSSASMKSEYDSEKQYPPQNYDDRFNGPYNSFDTDENYKGQYNRPKKGGYPDQQFNAPKHYGPYGPNVKDSKHQKKGHKSQHAPNVFGHPQQHLDMRKGPGNFQQEAFRGMTPDNRQKTGEALMREEYEKAKESKKELAKERTALGNLLKYIDTSFEYEMMRSMKAKNKETSPVKEKGMRSTLFFYMKKYKLLFPLLFNLIAVAILAMMGFEVGAIVLCIVGIMMVVYYEVKLNKIKRMHRAFKKFNARYHVLP
ncbi:Plasmodium exported protein, unknown function [Plasmodium vivax]|uniref:Pv-fam-d protein n=1 Tax=Plasmodium vivax TaxID=5855 RepID=A0A565A297_PLAVI|nr:Plasmodium exported protein, unknown function [Plasmodium vivax]